MAKATRRGFLGFLGGLAAVATIKPSIAAPEKTALNFGQWQPDIFDSEYGLLQISTPSPASVNDAIRAIMSDVRKMKQVPPEVLVKELGYG